MNIVAYLILAGIAGFIFLQLRSALGKTPYDPEERKRGIRNGKDLELSAHDVRDVKSETGGAKYEENTIVLPVKHQYIEGDKEKSREIADKLNEIKQHYPAFSADKFIAGSQKAYSAVIEAFAADKLSDISAYVTDDVLRVFQDVRDDWRGKNYVYDNALIQIEACKISDVSVNSAYAEITVSYIAETVGALYDETGAVIQGDPKKVTRTSDTWIFRRKHSDSLPVWILVSSAAR